jgi:small conductance mechanosensitive channel
LEVVDSRLAVLLQMCGVVVFAAAAYVILRISAGIAVRGLLERRTEENQAGPLAAAEFERRVTTLQRLGLRVAGITIAVIALLMILRLFLIDIGPAIAGFGVVGIAVGLGAQTVIRDWLAGVFVVLENQYNLGDVVRIAGVEGIVEDFSLRRTTVRDTDGALHTVPNGQILVASNLARGWSRVNLEIAVSHETDLQAATELLDRVGTELADDPEWAPLILEAPFVLRIASIGETTVTLKMLGRVRPAQQWTVGGELRARILAAFGRAELRTPAVA